MRRLRPLSFTVALLLLAGACHSGPAHPGPNDGAALNFDAKATLVIDDTGFQPATLHGRVGDAVTVTNKGTSPHGLTSESTDAGVIDTGTLQPGESSTVFFTATGTITVHDRFAPDHTATIEIGPEANTSG
jgi:plastocyanin